MQRVELVTVTMSKEAHAVLCGLVQPTEQVDSELISSERWDELRRLFPIEQFWPAVERGLVDYDAEKEKR